MTHKSYRLSPAKIGNQDGFRLPRAFSKDHPELVQASGEVEVIDDRTLLVRLEPTPLEEDDEDGLMMGLFLDFLMKQAIANPDTLVPYTDTMGAELDVLLADVVLNE